MPVKLAVDVHYKDEYAIAAGVVFDNWTDRAPRSCHVSFVDDVSEYLPGQFYKRELPCILQLLKEHRLSPEYILIDAYVYLDGYSIPGLGKYLYDALEHQVKIIGVAKNPFKSISPEFEVYRGGSERPLYVTCAGEELSVCKKRVQSMSGCYRYPTLLKRVDQLSKQAHR